MEDEVYDDVNDNYQYLPTSPLARPDFPLDLYDNDPSSPSYGNQYGTFIFFRYLSERLQRPVDRPPDLGARRREPDRPGRLLHPGHRQCPAKRSRESASPSAFGAFAAVNAFPASFYEEGGCLSDAADRPPGDPDRETAEPLRPMATLDHLTSAYHSLRPGAGVGANARLRVTLDLPPRAQGPQATLVVVRTSGALRFVPLTLNGQGDGTATVPFGRGKVKAVLAVLTNASTRYTRLLRPPFLPYACYGLPVDDDRVYRYTAQLMQARR